MNLKTLGVLAGLDLPDPVLRAWAQSADVIYAADSAANRLVPMGFRPTIVGDLDSVSPQFLLKGTRIVKDADPERTDCDKLLELVENDGRDAVTLAGVEGDLMDHVLASLSSIGRSNLQARIVTRTSLGHVVRSNQPATVPNGFGRRVSLIPLTRATGVHLTGVVWELNEAQLEPGGHLSVSNEGTGDVSASVTSGTAILFVQTFPGEDPLW